MFHRISLIFLCLCLLFAVGCGAQQPDPLPAAQTPQRVAALSRSLAELWLLAGGDLAGVTEDALDLDGLGAEAVSVGTISRPNLEAILALAPQLVLMSGELSFHTNLIPQLEQAGVECLPITVASFADYREIMSFLCARTGRADLYQSNVIDVEAAMRAVLEEAAGSIEANRQAERSYLALQISATKNKALKDNFACEILSDFGLRNVADGNTALDELSLEAIVAADPDYIFLIPKGEEDEAERSFREAFAHRPVWRELSAIREGRLYRLPKDLFEYKPNARWGEVYAYVETLLWP